MNNIKEDVKIVREEIAHGILILDGMRTEMFEKKLKKQLQNKGIDISNIEICYEGASDNNGLSETQETIYRVYQLKKVKKYKFETKPLIEKKEKVTEKNNKNNQDKYSFENSKEYQEAMQKYQTALENDEKLRIKLAELGEIKRNASKEEFDNVKQEIDKNLKEIEKLGNLIAKLSSKKEKMSEMATNKTKVSKKLPKKDDNSKETLAIIKKLVSLGINPDDNLDKVITKLDNAVSARKITQKEADNLLIYADKILKLQLQEEVKRLREENNRYVNYKYANIYERKMQKEINNAKDLHGHDEAIGQLESHIAKNNKKIKKYEKEISSSKDTYEILFFLALGEMMREKENTNSDEENRENHKETSRHEEISKLELLKKLVLEKAKKLGKKLSNLSLIKLIKRVIFENAMVLKTNKSRKFKINKELLDNIKRNISEMEKILDSKKKELK